MDNVVLEATNQNNYNGKIYVTSVERLLRAVYSKHTHKHYNINPEDIENLKPCKVRKDLISNYL